MFCRMYTSNNPLIYVMKVHHYSTLSNLHKSSSTMQLKTPPFNEDSHYCILNRFARPKCIITIRTIPIRFLISCLLLWTLQCCRESVRYLYRHSISIGGTKEICVWGQEATWDTDILNCAIEWVNPALSNGGNAGERKNPDLLPVAQLSFGIICLMRFFPYLLNSAGFVASSSLNL